MFYMCYFLMAIPFNLPTDEETEDNYRRLDQLLADLYDVLRQILLRPRLHQPPQRDLRDAARQQNEVASGGGTDPDPPDRDSDDRSLLGLPDLVLSAVPSPDDACAPPQSPCPPQSTSPSTAQPDTTTTTTATTTSSTRRLPARHPRRRTRRRRAVCCSSKTPRCRVPEAETSARSLTPSTAASQSIVKFTCEFNRMSTSTENWALVGHQLRKIAEDFTASHKKEESATRTEEKLQVEVKTSSLFSLLVPAPFGGSIWTTVILIVGWRLLMRQR